MPNCDDFYTLAVNIPDLADRLSDLAGSIEDLQSQLTGIYTKSQVDALLDDLESDILGDLVVPNFTYASPLLNGWSNVGGGPRPAHYAIDALGMVHVGGTVKGGETLTAIFTLPDGYLPLEEYHTVAAMNNGVTLTICRIVVSTSGDVIYRGPTPTNVVYIGHLTHKGYFASEIP